MYRYQVPSDVLETQRETRGVSANEFMHMPGLYGNSFCRLTQSWKRSDASDEEWCDISARNPTKKDERPTYYLYSYSPEACTYWSTFHCFTMVSLRCILVAKRRTCVIAECACSEGTFHATKNVVDTVRHSVFFSFTYGLLIAFLLFSYVIECRSVRWLEDFSVLSPVCCRFLFVPK